MSQSLEMLRRDAKRLARAYDARSPEALARVEAIDPRPGKPLRHSDFLHVVAREAGFASWPAAKFADETIGMDLAQRRQRLRQAVYHGQHWIVEELLARDPDTSDDFALSIVLYDVPAVRARLTDDPEAATRMLGPRRPILHLAFSRHIQTAPEKADAMLAVADLLLAHGADVNDGWDKAPGQRLSALFAAIGHGRNPALADWLLRHGADPNDGESLYHAVELGAPDMVARLIARGAQPAGTNALAHAMDANNHAIARVLLEAGAPLADGPGAPVLHHAAMRGCDAEMIGLLLGAGADPAGTFQGATAYAWARVYGHRSTAAALEAAGAATPLSEVEQMLAWAAEGQDGEGTFLDPATLSPAFRRIIRDIAHLPGRADHIRRLAALGVEYDLPDAMGVPPVQVAGWAGRLDEMTALLELRPDLSRVNAHGGSLLGAILHGAGEGEGDPDSDHLGCVRVALEHGVALPKWALNGAGGEEISAFLKEWADRHPGQVVPV